jgi:hypothetical protein
MGYGIPRRSRLQHAEQNSLPARRGRVQVNASTHLHHSIYVGI